MSIASILSDLWREGGAFEAPPQAQELQKSPGRIGLKGSHWMGSHCHNWVDKNGVTFLVELLEWGCTFSGFLGKESSGRPPGI